MQLYNYYIAGLIIDAITSDLLVGTTNDTAGICSTWISSPYANGLLYSLHLPIKLPGGTVLAGWIQIDPIAGKTNTAREVFGSLIAEEDLYVQATPTIRNISPNLNEGAVYLKVRGGYDSILRVEQSCDLLDDQWTSVAMFATGIAAERTISLADAPSAQKYYRLRNLSNQ